MSHTCAARCTVCSQVEDPICPECGTPSSDTHGTTDQRPWREWHPACVEEDDNLPANRTSTDCEHGVLLDRRDQGLGVVLLSTHSSVYAALNVARKTSGKAHVRSRLVTRSPWSAPIRLEVEE